MKSSLARSLCTVWLVAACGETAPPAESPGGEAEEAIATARAAAEDAETPITQEATAPRRVEINVSALGFDLGSLDAPVQVIEMSDYGCGYCRKFHEETWPVLREEFVDAGKIRWKFLPFVSGMFKNSTAATQAAECTLEQGDALFEAMNSRLWADQKTWKGSADPAPVLRGMAGEEGVDLARYDSCLSEDRRGKRVTQATSVAHQVGVRGTPTFFVLGYQPLQGALPTEAFRKVLGLVVEDATKRGGGR